MWTLSEVSVPATVLGTQALWSQLIPASYVVSLGPTFHLFSSHCIKYIYVKHLLSLLELGVILTTEAAR